MKFAVLFLIVKILVKKFKNWDYIKLIFILNIGNSTCDCDVCEVGYNLCSNGIKCILPSDSINL